MSLRRNALALFTAFALAAVPVLAGEAAADRVAGARKYFTDVELINQDGQPMRLYSDLLDGKTVVINTFFTTCTGACPATSRTLKKVQDWLGDRLGKDVFLISISVDPEHDTPPRIKEFGAQFGAKPGWIFLTGAKANVDLALAKLGSFVEKRDDHVNLLFIGNEKTGLWKKAFSLAPAEELIPIVQSVVEDKGP